MAKLLRMLGWKVEGARRTELTIAPPTGKTKLKLEAPYELVKQMRASVLVLGPLVARFGRAQVSLPGGCAIGARPIDQHLKGLEAMGAKITLEHGYVDRRVPKRPRAAPTSCFDMPTVTGTENLMMAAALAKGRTHARERGARARGRRARPRAQQDGRASRRRRHRRHHIEGVDELQPFDHAIIPDRIEAGTFMVAAATTGGDVLLEGAALEHLEALVAKLRQAGVEVATRGQRRARARATAPFAPSTSPPRRTPASRPTCRRSSWCSMCLAEGRA